MKRYLFLLFLIVGISGVIVFRQIDLKQNLPASVQQEIKDANPTGQTVDEEFKNTLKDTSLQKNVPNMNEDSLNAVRKRISRKYIGKEGIHGVGMRRTENAVSVYLKATSNPQQKMILEEIEKEVAPYKVLIIEEEPPQFQ